MGRLSWRTAIVVATEQETATARTLTLRVDGWTGHRPGQHVDIRLTAADGYTAVRPYSIATPADGPWIGITVELVEGGEVSSYLVSETVVGTKMEVRGPLGRWFVWDPAAPVPAQLVGGGVGVVPLMAMLRQHDRNNARHPMRLLYSASTPGRLLYAREIARRSDDRDAASSVTVLYTRTASCAAARPPGRLTYADMVVHALPPTPSVDCYVCGPTGFVESVIALLLKAGHPDTKIRAERFG